MSSEQRSGREPERARRSGGVGASSWLLLAGLLLAGLSGAAASADSPLLPADIVFCLNGGKYFGSNSSGKSCTWGVLVALVLVRRNRRLLRSSSFVSLD